MSDEVTSGTISVALIEADPEVTAIVGIFIARWSLAEHALMLALLVVLNTRNQEMATTILANTNSAEAKIKLVSKALYAADTIDEARRVAIKAALKRLESLCSERNAIVHHLWGCVGDNQIITLDYRKSVPAAARKHRTAREMKELCNRVIDAAQAISEATGSKWITAQTTAHLKFALPSEAK